MRSFLLFLSSLVFIISFTGCKKQEITTLPQPPVAGSNILQSWDFEGMDAMHNLIVEDDSPSKNSISIVPDPNNPSNKVMKVLLPKGMERTEVSLSASDLKTIQYFYADAMPGFTDKAKSKPDLNSLGNEVWMSIKILKPQEQNTNGIKPSVAQFGPVSNASLIPAVASSGFCQLRLRNGSTPTGDDWNWRVFGATVYTPADLTSDQNFIKPNYGKWEKFVFHCKYNSTTDGILEVWKDGVKYINQTGANAISFNRFRIKWGLYIGVGNKLDIDLNCYFDDIKIAGSNSNYNEISR